MLLAQTHLPKRILLIPVHLRSTEVAVKVVPQLSDDGTAQAGRAHLRNALELAAVTAVSHPSIVQVRASHEASLYIYAAALRPILKTHSLRCWFTCVGALLPAQTV